MNVEIYFYTVYLYKKYITSKQNNILTRQLERGDSIRFGGLTKGVVIMSTYEEFMIIIAVASLIVSILYMKNKK